MHIKSNDLRKLACYVCPYSTLINKPKLCLNECKMQMLKTINRSIDKVGKFLGVGYGIYCLEFLDYFE